MDSLALARRITDIVVEKQGEDVLILDIQELTTIAEYFVICSGTSGRQLDALKEIIREQLKKETPPVLPISVEGQPESGWILMDYGGVIVHLFDPEIRSFYRLEDLWKGGRIIARIQ